MSQWLYPMSVKTGYFKSPRPVVDPGEFTMMSADIPLRALRRKPLALTMKSRKMWKKARLTPIHENEELNKESLLDGVKGGTKDVVKSRLVGIQHNNDDEIRHNTNKPGIDRSDTPVTIRISRRVLRKVDDRVEDELANILEDDSNFHLRDPEVRRRLAELPPRPSCKRKVLPPSVTGNSDVKHRSSRVKVLRVRQKLEHSLDPLHKAGVKHGAMKEEVMLDYFKNSISRKTPRKGQESNPTVCCENDVCVLTLNDLKRINKASDTIRLPSGEVSSAISKLVKPDEDRSSESSTVDDNGSLYTSRFGQSMKEDMQEEKCLKGTDLASFYNMWDRDNSRRPFGHNVPGKLPLYRSCMCAFKSPANRNCRAHHLPPL